MRHGWGNWTDNELRAVQPNEDVHPKDTAIYVLQNLF